MQSVTITTPVSEGEQASVTVPAAPAPAHLVWSRCKRWLYIAHRWLGIVLCLFFAMWFVSGVVMMYVGYPKLTPAERIAHLPPLAPERIRDGLVGPEVALKALGDQVVAREIALAAAHGGRPVYLITPDVPPNRGRKGSRVRKVQPAIAVDAHGGQRVTAITPELALASAAAFMPDVGRHYMGTVDEDAYTHSRALDAHRPLHIVDLADAAGTRLYISGSTGEVVRDATGTERVWNWAGAWIHWLYPFRGNVFDAYYSDIVIWLSVAGMLLALAGTVVGILRWRFSGRYHSRLGGGSHSPYRGGMMRWHHFSGLLFAAVTFTWIMSGLFSVNPWQIFDSGAPRLAERAYAGVALTAGQRLASPQALIAAAGGNVREIVWKAAAGRLIAHVNTGGPVVQLFDAHDASPFSFKVDALAEAAGKLFPAAAITNIEVLIGYDFYYYARTPHSMMGHVEKPLPVWRLKFNDANATWVHLDPHTGAVLGRLDGHGRVKRWLFAFLHSWDWLPLLERRPFWDILLIVLSAGGIILSATGVVIGWRRLRRKMS